jgi:ParB family chromosome partitioning protein
MKRKALGKGLSALLPVPDAPAEAVITAPSVGEPTELPISDLEPNPQQPRTVMDPVRLQELGDSIRESGVVQPILVRRVGSGFQIVAGERRWRAAQQAGLERVPVVVRDIPDDRLLEVALVENIQRQELSPIEEAHAYQRLQDELSLSQEELAKRVGKERSTVANTLRLLRLPKDVRELLAKGRLDAGHGRALLALEREEEQLALARESVQRGLSVRDVERRVAAARAAAPKPTPGKRVDANTQAAEERLRAALGTRVEIARARRGGSIKIAFLNESELNRLYDALLRIGQGR